ncbi:MAG TPA: IS110 family transposase [Candidatus Angelobacter sp.]|nr:IS110 family transposase [Candidatus Angelobacter sp.]
MDNRKSTASAVVSDVATVYVAIELSMKNWLAAVRSPRQEQASRHKLAAADARGLWSMIERERAALLRCGHSEVRVVTCYEAGRDGFWLHRFLVAHGAESRVVDPGSVLVNRRARRAKSDRLDVEGLLRLVIRHDAGDRHLGRMVAVPSVAEEDARRPGRERQRLLSERTAHSNRIQGLLATHGAYGYRPLRTDRWVQLAALRGADGQSLPAQVHDEIVRELHRLEYVQAQIAAVEKQRASALGEAAADDRGARHAIALLRLRGFGMEFSNMLAREVYYREFANRRKVASYIGLTPSPFQSGGIDHEQGIAKAGNRRARSTAIELAWLWLRHQPDSELSRWFHARLGANKSGRLKRILIVALARKLVVALWRYLTTGLLPQGARLKPS